MDDFTSSNLKRTLAQRFQVGRASEELSAALQVDSTSAGFLLPRMTTAEREAISSPAEGLQVFDTDVKRLFLYGGASWRREEAESLETDLTLYVDGSAGDDANDGLTWGTAKQTFAFLRADSPDAIPREINADLLVSFRNDIRASSADGLLVVNGFFGSGSITIQGELTAVETFTASGYENDELVQGSQQWVSDATKTWTPDQWRRHFVDLGHTWKYPIRTNNATTLFMGFGDEQYGAYAATIYSAPEILRELVSAPGVKYVFNYDKFVNINHCSLKVVLRNAWIDEDATDFFMVYVNYCKDAMFESVAACSLGTYNSDYFSLDQSYLNLHSYGFWSQGDIQCGMQNSAIDSVDLTGYGIYQQGHAECWLAESWVGHQLFAITSYSGSFATMNRSVYIQECDVGIFLVGAELNFQTPLPEPLQLRFDTVAKAITGLGRVYKTLPFEIIGWDVTSEFYFSDTDEGSFVDFSNNALRSRLQMQFAYANIDYEPIYFDEYDNTTSGLVATRYQTAVDELAARSIDADLTMYVDGTTGDDANDGLTWGTAKLTAGFLVEGESDALPREINAAVVINVRGPIRGRSATAPPLNLTNFYGLGSITVTGELTAEETFTASTYDNVLTNQGSLQWLEDGTKSWTTNQWRRHFADIGTSDMYPIRSNTGTRLYTSCTRAVPGTPAGTIYSAPEVLSELADNPGVKYDFDAPNYPAYVLKCDVFVTIEQLWFDEYFDITHSMSASQCKSVYLYRVSLPTFRSYQCSFFEINVFYANLVNYEYCLIYGGYSYVGYGVIDSTDATGYGLYTTQPGMLTMYRTWIGNQVTGLWVAPVTELYLQDNIYFKDCTDAILMFDGCLYGEVVVGGYMARFDGVTRGIVGAGSIIKLDVLKFIGWNCAAEVVFSDTDSGSFADLTANTLRSRSGLNIMSFDADYRPVLLDEYDNTASGLTATRYQTAIDELAADIADGPNYAQEVTVAKAGAQYGVIQGALDSIIDAATDKKYVVRVFPGEYDEEVVSKDNVDVVGIGPPRSVVIRSSTGTPVTMSNTGRSDLRNLTVERLSSVNDEHAIEVTAGTHLIYDCVLTQNSTDASGCVCHVSGTGVVQLNTGQVSLVQSGAAAGAGNINRCVHNEGSGLVLIRGINAYLELGDAADNATAFDDDSGASGSVSWQDCFVDVNVTVAGFAGSAVAVCEHSNSVDKNVLTSRLRVRNSSGDPSGIGAAYRLDSDAGGARVLSAHNLIDVTGFASNYLGDIGTGDVIVSEFNAVDAVNGCIGAGSVLNEDGVKLLHGVVARSTAAGLNCLPTHITTTTFTLGATANPIPYFYNGIQCVVSADKTATLDDGAGGSTAGLYYVYFVRATGSIVATKTFPGLIEGANVLIAFVYWNGTNYGLVTDERHSYKRNQQWHEWAHYTVGARYYSGFDFVPTGNGATATFTMSGGDLYDEDIAFSAVASSSYPTPHTLRTWYQTGATTYTFDSAPVTTPFRAGAAGRPTYVNETGYVLTEASSAPNRYFNFFIYGVADMHTPVYCFAETLTASVAGTNGYTSAAAARAARFPALNAYGLSPELRPLYRLVVKANGDLEALISEDDYRRVTTLPLAAGSTSTSASAVTFIPAGGIASTNVQLALEEVGAEKAPIASPTFTGIVSSPEVHITGNGSGSTAQVVNVLYGIGDPPSTSGLPYGTLYIKHEA